MIRLFLNKHLASVAGAWASSGRLHPAHLLCSTFVRLPLPSLPQEMASSLSPQPFEAHRHDEHFYRTLPSSLNTIFFTTRSFPGRSLQLPVRSSGFVIRKLLGLRIFNPA